MSTTTPNMGLIKPDPDGSEGTWDTELNASLDTADAHDHTSGNGVKVPVAGLNINADLTLNSFGLTNAKILDMAPVDGSVVTSYLHALYVNDADNELYWRNDSGTEVRVTSGAGLNVAVEGGITGAGYGSSGVEVNWVAGSTIYNLLRAADHRAYLDTSDIRLFEGTSGITNAVKLKSPAALAASYDLVMPTALPGSTSLLQVTSAGQVQTTLTPSVTTLTTTSTATTGGLLTASAGVTAAANQHVTISGTGRFKHGVMQLPVAAGAGYGNGYSLGSDAQIVMNATTDVLYIPPRLPVGARITAWSVRCLDNSTGSTTVTAEGFVLTDALSATGDAATSSGAGSLQTITDASVGYTIAASETYLLRVTISAANDCEIYWAQFSYDFP